MAPRSRTGCQTCRQRKLKCSEEKPTCAQCAKANRECIQSSGITFRHQQNPSMNDVDYGDGMLKSFYGYRETFNKDLKWVKIPKDLTFIPVHNPYADESTSDASALAQLAMLAREIYQDRTHVRIRGSFHAPAYSANSNHGLEALSTVASQDQSGHDYAPPAAFKSLIQRATQQQSPAGAGAEAQPPAPISAGSHNNLDLILNRTDTNPTRIDSPNIDPQLQAATPTSADHPGPQQSPNHVRLSSYSSPLGRLSLQSKGPQTGARRSSIGAARRSANGRPSMDVRRCNVDDADLAFLLRDFSERAGLWMDLFDLRLFFAMQVPVLAVKCPLLLHACAALSAKSLARVNGRRPVLGGQITASRQCSMEFWPGTLPHADGWVRKAREHYDQAVSLLRQALEGESRPNSSAQREQLGHPLPRVLSTPSPASNKTLPTTDSDELVAATAILCVYEFLDASRSEWSRHLDGAKTLFDIAKDRMVPLTLPPSPASPSEHMLQRSAEGSAHLATYSAGSVGISQAQEEASPFVDHFLHRHAVPSRPLSQGRRAVFWNFARQDMLSAFINNTCTRLDTSDLAMWRDAGLKLTTEGYICSSNPSSPDYRSEHAMSDDLIANALIWLQQKLVNFISSGDEIPAEISPLGFGVRQNELLRYWEDLERQLRVWHDGLPASFHPVASTQRDCLSIEEKWFPRPMCASAMQNYHFACIQLLLNKPHLSTGTPLSSEATSASPGNSLAARHASYATILQQSRAHAKEIVSIGLGRSDEGSRIHSVQPLWTAGLVLGGAEDGVVSADVNMWRRSVILQLRGIEHDMGWASEYRVQNLLDLWSLPPNWAAEGS